VVTQRTTTPNATAHFGVPMNVNIAVSPEAEDDVKGLRQTFSGADGLAPLVAFNGPLLPTRAVNGGAGQASDDPELGACQQSSAGESHRAGAQWAVPADPAASHQET
jgi:hypothetical protein